MRLIDADKIPYSRETIVDESGYPADFLVAYKDDVDRQPTVEAELVRRGHWIEENDIQICSECGEEHSFGVYRPSYCDTCGSKMDAEDNDGQ